MASTRNAGKPSNQLPTGKPYSGNGSRLAVAAHVNAYVTSLSPAQRATFYALPASVQAASAGCALYSTQYAWRQHLRSSGARVAHNAAANWGQAGKAGKAGKYAATANATATKLAKAGAQGAAQAKGAAVVPADTTANAS